MSTDTIKYYNLKDKENKPTEQLIKGNMRLFFNIDKTLSSIMELSKSIDSHNI